MYLYVATFVVLQDHVRDFHEFDAPEHNATKRRLLAAIEKAQLARKYQPFGCSRCYVGKLRNQARKEHKD